MSGQVIYIYYDTVGNNVLSKGIVNFTKKSMLKRTPNNLLLIKDGSLIGTHDNHTGFQVMKGQESVKAFLDSGIGNPSKLGSWIDFSSIEMLHQLTPVEISEILYIAHAHNYLHSPFYYKLQNNYIYLSLPNGFTKVYYRYLEEFMDQFVDAISQHMQNKINEKKRFYQKEKMIPTFSISNMEELIPLFREGICFSFRQIKIEDGVYRVPLFIAEDNLSKVNRLFDEANSLGYLEYNAEHGKWKLEYQFE